MQSEERRRERIAARGSERKMGSDARGNLLSGGHWERDRSRDHDAEGIRPRFSGRVFDGEPQAGI